MLWQKEWYGAIAAAGYRNKLYPYWISKTKDILLLWDMSKESHRIHFWNNLQTVVERILDIKSISSNLFIVESSKTFLLTLTHDVQNFFHQAKFKIMSKSICWKHTIRKKLKLPWHLTDFLMLSPDSKHYINQQSHSNKIRRWCKKITFIFTFDYKCRWNRMNKVSYLFTIMKSTAL